jgi:GDP-mannose 6-dehydrogenase
MEILCQDTKLNISRRYLKPGFSFGGSCLPKDLRAIGSELGKRGVRLPLLQSILDSNEVHLRRCIQLVTQRGKHKVGLVGLSFKAGTDDLRESPAVELAERLIGKGFDVTIYEKNIAPGTIYGSNLNFIEHSIPHIWKLLVHDLAEVLEQCQTVVVMQRLSAEERALFEGMRPDQVCIDLARTLSSTAVGGEYQTASGPLGNGRDLSQTSSPIHPKTEKFTPIA